MTALHRGRLARAAVVGATALLVAAGAGAPAVAAPPSGATEQRMPQGQRGTLLDNRPLTGPAALPSAAVNRTVSYVSQGARGQRIVVSGIVSLPRSAPPPGGWPVISWAHGTVGTGDGCAPSRTTIGGPAQDYLGAINPTLDQWVARGYAVVQSDFEGLGTPGEHPYINGESAANTVTDIVRAARDLDRRVGRDWVVVGHSQGGHAALFTAAQQQRRSDVRLLGAVSIAPGGYDISTATSYYAYISALPRDAAVATLAFLPALLIGAEAADPAIDAEALLTDAAQPLLVAGRTGCQADTRAAAAAVPQADPFLPGADLGPLTEYLRAQQPEHLTLRVPTLVAQGTTDALIPRPTTDALVDQLCNRAPVTYEVYEGADHRASVAASFDDAVAFTETLFRGGTPAPTC